MVVVDALARAVPRWLREIDAGWWRLGRSTSHAALEIAVRPSRACQLGVGFEESEVLSPVWQGLVNIPLGVDAHEPLTTRRLTVRRLTVPDTLRLLR